jgi:plasmid stabilization system protein ParE
VSVDELFYSPLALADLDAIFDIVGSDYPQRGYDFVEAIRERLRKYLLDNAELGRARPDLGEGIRIYPVKSKRIVVAYRIEVDAIMVVRVFYGGAAYEATFQDADDNE